MEIIKNILIKILLNNIEIIYWFLAIIILLELFFYFVVNSLSKFYDKSYDWKKNKLITNLITKKDIKIKIDKAELLKNKIYFFDKELGTTNKKNITNSESFYEGRRLFKSKYSIGKEGERSNLKFSSYKNLISTYGDSLTFCRYVNDYETWQYQMSKRLKKDIKNFGVGNYGLDQAYLKYKLNKKKKIDKSKIVIFGFGPETIRRNLSTWKHLFEFGNYYNFKPRFKKIDDKNFKFIKNEIKDLDQLKKSESIFEKVAHNDFFYKKKFLRYVWKFPYVLSLTKQPLRRIILISFLISKFFEINFKTKLLAKINKFIYKDLYTFGPLIYDFKDKIELFNSDEAIKTTVHIIKQIKKINKNLVIVLIPSHLDFHHFKKNNRNYYDPLIEEISKITFCIDVARLIPKKIKINDIYTEKGYGAHLNKKGNQILSDLIINNLKKNAII